MKQCLLSIASYAAGFTFAFSGLAVPESIGQEAVPSAEAVVEPVSKPIIDIPTRLGFGEEGWVSVGARLQSLVIYNGSDLVSDDIDFRIRRARIFVRGEVTEWAGFSFATEVSGPGVILIDALLHLKPKDEVQLFVGRHLSPGPGRQAGTTSAGAMMAIDRPAFAYKNLSYGGRGATAFATSTIPGTDAGLRMDTQVRDEGVTFWGDHSRTENLHLKYYVGVYDGSKRSPGRAEADLRYSGRVAVNLGDDEGGFYNSSTYLGKKSTIGLGGSFDAQNRVASEQGSQRDIDYRFWTVDFFVEKPLGKGVVNFEAAYGQLDLDDAVDVLLDRDGNAFSGSAVSGQQAQGDGFYLQTGYYLRELRIQPWLIYEEWESDAANGVGSYTNARIGATYFARGHNLNFKIGYERTRLDWSPNSDRTSDSVVVGAYLTF